MATLPTVTAGDVGVVRDVQLGDEVDGAFTVLDFTATVSAVEAHVWKRGSAGTTLTAAFTDEATGTIRVQMGDAGGWLPTLAIAYEEDEYLIEYQVTFVSSATETWGPDVLPVRRAGG